MLFGFYERVFGILSEVYNVCKKNFPFAFPNFPTDLIFSQEFEQTTITPFV